MEMGFQDRVALVTGSSQGFGQAIARLLGREGARVVVTYRHHRDQADAVAAEIQSTGGEAMVVFFDLASDDAIRTAVDTTLRQWGHVDIVVNNAVVWGARLPSQAPLLEDLPADEWRPLVRANLEGAFRTIQAVVPSMRQRHWGRIVNISSGVAVDGVPGASWYGAAKAGLHGLTRTLAKELGPEGILTNVVMPGFTLTEQNAERLPAAVVEQMAQASPLRRLLPPEEVAPIVVFLCSPRNSAINGETIRASGGIT